MMTTPRPSPADPLNHAGVGAGGLGGGLLAPATPPNTFRGSAGDPCGEVRAAAVSAQGIRRVNAPAAWPGFLNRPARYPNAYCWYVLVCALDLMLTNTVIHYAGAIEVNAIAARALELGDFWGLIGLKVATMIVVLLACEMIGETCVRRAHPEDTGLKLAEWAVAISAIPVALTLLQLAFVAFANLMLI